MLVLAGRAQVVQADSALPSVSLILTRSMTERERLAAAHVAEDRGRRAGLDELVVVLLRLHPGALRPVHDLVAELVVGDLDVLGVGEGVEQQLDLDALGGRLGQLGVDLLLGLLLERRGSPPGRRRCARAGRPSPACGCSTSSLTTPSGAGTSAASTSCLERLVAGGVELLDLLDPAEPLAQVVAQLVEGVELAGQLGELVVELGQLLLLDACAR